MSTQSRSQLRTYFETGDIPTEQQFSNFIESTLNLNDDCVFIPVPPVGQSPKVGIGTPVPLHKLDVTGDIKTDQFIMPTGATDGYVLTSDATGNATWQPTPAPPVGPKFVKLNYEVVRKLKQAGNLDPGCMYCIPDAGSTKDDIVVLKAIATDQLSLEGSLIAKNADYQDEGNYDGIGGATSLGIWYNTLEVPMGAIKANPKVGEELFAFSDGKNGTGFFVGKTKTGIIVRNARGSWDPGMTISFKSTGLKAVINGDSISELRPHVGDVVIWDNLHYQNVTGFNGSEPSTDITNWKLIAKNTINGGYITEVDFIEFILEPVVKNYTGNGWMQRRTDARSNDMASSPVVDEQSFRKSRPALDFFQWGSDRSFANHSNEGLLDNRNDFGIYGGNLLEQGAIMSDNNSDLKGSILGNRLATSARVIGNYVGAAGFLRATTIDANGFVLNNYIGPSCELSRNHILASGSISENTMIGSSDLARNTIGQFGSINDNYLSTECRITDNTLGQYGTISNNDMLGSSGLIGGNTLAHRAFITLIVMTDRTGIVNGNTLDIGAGITDQRLDISSQISGNKLGIGSQMASNFIGQFLRVNGNTLESSASFSSNTINHGGMDSTVLAKGVTFSNKTFDSGGSVGLSYIGIKFAKVETITTNIGRKRCEPGFSDIEGTVNVDAGFFATTIDIDDPSNYLTEIAGVITLRRGTPTDQPKTIDTILNLSTFYPTEFRGVTGFIGEFTSTPVASAIGGKFALQGGAGFSLTGRDTGSDFLTLRDDDGTIREIASSTLV